MTARQLRRALTVAVVIVGTAGLAFVLGSKAGRYFVETRRSERFLLTRAAQTEQMLKQMNTIAIGDTLPDHVFQDIEGNPMKLSEVLSRWSVLSLFDLGCEACLEEIEHIQATVSNESEARYFVLIASGAPASLTELRRQYDLDCPILCDEDHQFFSWLNVMGIPFNMIVNRDRVIERVVSGSLTREELREVIKDNKGTK